MTADPDQRQIALAEPVTDPTTGDEDPHRRAAGGGDHGDDLAVREVRNRFVRAAAIGGGLATVLFLWLVTRGTFDLFQWQRVGEFYDQQAHSFLHGRISIDPAYLGIEAFTVDGSSHIYQGPIPAILRLPIIALSGHALDGRLTQVSMLLGFVVAIVFAARLHWQARRVLRGDAPMSTTEAFLVGVLTFAIAGSSTLLFEGSRAWVYHEALVWGAAFAIAAIDAMVAYLRRPSPARLGWTAFFAMCCLLTRASVGMGPVVGLGLLFAGSLAVALARRWPGRIWNLVVWLAPRRPATDAPDAADAAADDPDASAANDGDRATSPWWLLGATVLPMAAYALVNYIKFERLFSIPFWGQRFSEIDPARQVFLQENGGTMFGLKFAPTTALQYLRPDAIRFVGHFPFVEFPDFPGRVIGGVNFDLIDRTSSVPTAMTLLTILAIVGSIAVFRPRAWHRPDHKAPLRVPILAAGAAAATVIPFGYIANRYLTDFVPFLAIAAAVGLQTVVPRLTAPAARRWAPVAVAGIVMVAAMGTWTNLGLALSYQRQWSYNLDPPVVAAYLRLQDDLGGVGPVTRIERGSAFPDGIGHPGDLVVVGDCEALYISDGLPLNVVKRSPWNAVEQTRAAGHFDLDLTFPEREVGTRVPVLAFEDSPAILVAEYVEGGRIMFEYVDPSLDVVVRGLPRDIETNRRYHVDVRADPNIDLMVVLMGDTVMLDAFFDVDSDRYVLGRNPGTPGVVTQFPGTISERPTSAPLCARLVGERAS